MTTIPRKRKRILLLVVTIMIVIVTLRQYFYLTWQPVTIRLLVKINEAAWVMNKTLRDKDSGQLIIVSEFNENILPNIIKKYGKGKDDVKIENFNKGHFLLLSLKEANGQLKSIEQPKVYRYVYGVPWHYYYRINDEEKLSYNPSISGGGYKIEGGVLKNTLVFVVFIEGFQSPFIVEKNPPFTSQVKYPKYLANDNTYPCLTFKVTSIDQMIPLDKYKYASEVKKNLNLKQ